MFIFRQLVSMLSFIVVGISSAALVMTVLNPSVYKFSRVLETLLAGIAFIIICAWLAPENRWREFYYLVVCSFVMGTLSLGGWSFLVVITKLPHGFDLTGSLICAISALLFVLSRSYLIALSKRRQKR